MVIVNFLTVEVMVTVTGGAFQRVECTFFSGNQELATTVHRVASHTHRVVLQAFSVSCHRRRSGGRSLYLVIVDEVVGLVVGLTSLGLLLLQFATAIYLVNCFRWWSRFGEDVVAAAAWVWVREVYVQVDIITCREVHGF